LQTRVNDYKTKFEKLLTCHNDNQQDIIRELQQKFKMPLDEIVAKKRREAETLKRRMTISVSLESPNL